MSNNKFSNPFVLLLILVIAVGSGILFYLKKRRPHLLPPETIAQNAATSSFAFNTNFFFDLETPDGLIGAESFKPFTTAHSGKIACELTGGKEFGPSVVKKVGDISTQPLKQVGASVWVYPLSDNCGVVLTATITNSKNESVFWDGKSSENLNFPKNKWTKINALYHFPADKIKPEDILQINIWNKGKTDVWIDDIEVVYGETAEKRGSPATIDANTIYENHFVSQKNKPPFPVTYFHKKEINNNNSTFINVDKTKPNNDLSPNAEYLVGDFISDKNNLDELFCIKNNSLTFFQFDETKQQFKNELELPLSSEEQRVWTKDVKKFVGDFNSNGRTDILLIQAANNHWTLAELKNKSLVTITEGAFKGVSTEWFNEMYHPFVSRIFTDNKAEALTMLSNTNCYTLQLNKLKNTLEEKTNPLSTNDTGLFRMTNSVYEGVFTGDGKTSFLKLANDWRFDLKMLTKDSEGFIITNTIDFSGYINDYNPKYYEILKIVAGNFTSKNKTSLLILMGNCGDERFDGNNCKQIEELPYLPSSTQLYELVK